MMKTRQPLMFGDMIIKIDGRVREGWIIPDRDNPKHNLKCNPRTHKFIRTILNNPRPYGKTTLTTTIVHVINDQEARQIPNYQFINSLIP